MENTIFKYLSLKFLDFIKSYFMPIIISIIYSYLFYEVLFESFSNKYTTLSNNYINILIFLICFSFGFLTIYVIKYYYKKLRNKNGYGNNYNAVLKQTIINRDRSQQNYLSNQGIYLENFMKEALIWYNDQTLEYKVKLLELYLLPVRVDKNQREFYKEDDKQDKSRRNIFEFFVRKRKSHYYLNIQILSNTIIIVMDNYLVKILEEEHINKNKINP